MDENNNYLHNSLPLVNHNYFPRSFGCTSYADSIHSVSDYSLPLVTHNFTFHIPHSTFFYIFATK